MAVTDRRALDLATRIRVARVGAGLDQEQIAVACGTSRGTVSNWELGRHQIKLTDAVRLAAATGVTLEWLAEGVETEMAPTANSGSHAARPEGFEPPTFWSVVEPLRDWAANIQDHAATVELRDC